MREHIPTKCPVTHEPLKNRKGREGMFSNYDVKMVEIYLNSGDEIVNLVVERLDFDQTSLD